MFYCLQCLLKLFRSILEHLKWKTGPLGNSFLKGTRGAYTATGLQWELFLGPGRCGQKALKTGRDDGVQVPSACSEGSSPEGRRPITGLTDGGHD